MVRRALDKVDEKMDERGGDGFVSRNKIIRSGTTFPFGIKYLQFTKINIYDQTLLF